MQIGMRILYCETENIRSMTVSCIIIDDEPSAIEVLQNYCNKIASLQVIKTFRDPLLALEHLSENRVDVIFLDINMPQLDGMELANVLQKPQLIVFTTAYAEYAVESYEKNAVDYLLKPITFERFLIAFNKVQRLLKNKTDSDDEKNETKTNSKEVIHIKDGHKINRIALDDIEYLEKDGHYIIFHLDGKKVISRLSMKDVSELIPETDFMQVHKSYIIPIAQVEIV